MAFQHRSKEKQAQHIVENVHSTTMHKHVGEKLNWIKLGRAHIMQGQKLVGTKTKHASRQIYQHIDDDKIENDWSGIVEHVVGIFLVYAKLIRFVSNF